jgi:hypothetical protein
MRRTEYITLKRCLAAWRGYQLTAPLDRFERFNEPERTAKELDITQQEIRMALDLEHVADALALNFRRRLQRCATVEAAEFQLDDRCAGGRTIEEYEAEGVCGSERCGLTVAPRKDTEQTASAAGAE